MARKSKAEGADDLAPSTKKIKVTTEDVVMDDEEDEGPWDGIRVIGADQDVLCRTDGCQAKATATWASQKTGDSWDMCDACQLKDFGEIHQDNAAAAADDKTATDSNTNSDAPVNDGAASKVLQDDATPLVMSPDAAAAVDGSQGPMDGEGSVLLEDAKKSLPVVSEDSSNAASSPSAVSESGETPGPTEPVVAPQVVVTQTQDDAAMSDVNEPVAGSEDEGKYDLKKLIPMEDLLKNDNICCSQDACGGLPAFGLYVNSADATDRWYYCLDCQENDFDGWPPLEELPVKYIDAEHLRVMARKCSKRSNPPMPVFPTSPSSSSVSPMPDKTPATTTAHFVTPPPPKENTTKSKANKAKALEVHKKWLEAAQALGGKDVRIVVSKPAAKKLIFDFLYDAFQPMNITQIYKVSHA